MKCTKSTEVKKNSFLELKAENSSRILECRPTSTFFAVGTLLPPNKDDSQDITRCILFPTIRENNFFIEQIFSLAALSACKYKPPIQRNLIQSNSKSVFFFLFSLYRLAIFYDTPFLAFFCKTNTMYVYSKIIAFNV